MNASVDKLAPALPVADAEDPQDMLLQGLDDFCGGHAGRYRRQFSVIARRRLPLSFNPAAGVGGCLWAAGRALWPLFWLGLALDTLGLALLGVGISAGEPPRQLAGVLVLLGGRLALATLADHALWRQFCVWRGNPGLAHGFEPRRVQYGVALALLIVPMTVYRFAASEPPAFLASFPADDTLARGAAAAINAATAWLTTHFAPFFDAVTVSVRLVLDSLETVFTGMPWPVAALILLLLSWRAGGLRFVAFGALALAYLGLFGFWEKAMSTMSLVAASVFICVLFGVPLGVLSAKNQRFNALLTPLLDIMQTMPSFVYLLPAIAFFSIGKPPAVLATVVFAMPPVIRLTALGLQQVPSTVIEAMNAFGATRMQLLLKAELPLAATSIMAGINQSIMMSLSMVVIAALIGGGGLGYDVLFALQQMETGLGVLSGLAIVVCAMLLDRVTRRPEKRRRG